MPDTNQLKTAASERERALAQFRSTDDIKRKTRFWDAAAEQQGTINEGVADLAARLESIENTEARAKYADLNTSATTTTRARLPLLTEYRAALAEGSDSTGGYSVPLQQVNAFYDLLRAQSVVLKAGPRIVDMTSDTARVPRIASTTSTGWYSEGGTLSSTEMTLGAVDLTARKLGCYSLLSNEVLMDSTPSIRDMIAYDFAATMAAGLDKAFLEGSGTPPEPRGMRNFTSVTETHMGDNGDYVTLNALNQMIARVEADNGNIETMAFFMHPTVWSYIQVMSDGEDRPFWLPDVSAAARRRIAGVPVFVSSQISITEEQGSSGAKCSYIVLADMSQVCIGRRVDLSLVYSSDFKFDSDQTAVRATSRWDIQPINVTGIDVLDAIITS